MLSTVTASPLEEESTPNFLTRITSPLGYFIRNNKSWSTQVLGVTAAAGSVFTYTLIEKLMIEEPSLAVAHGMGAAIKYVLFPTVIVPYVMRLSTSMLQNSYIGNALGLDRRFASHKTIAVLLGSSSFIHTFGQIYHNPRISLTQEGFTGFGLILAFALPLGGAYLIAQARCVHDRRFPYEYIFLKPHQLGSVIFLTVYPFHTRDLRLVPYAAAVGGAFLIDRIIEFIFYHYNTVTTKAKMCGNLAEITLAKPIHFSHHAPGQFAYISLIEEGKFFNFSHPFTIANSHHENYLRFYLARNGCWTEKIIKQIAGGHFPPTSKARVIGPFGSPLQSQDKKISLILISTGSGLTPFIALLSHHAYSQAPINISVIHSSQHADEFLPYIKMIFKALCNGVKLADIHFYFTGKTMDEKEAGLRKLKDAIEASGLYFVDVDQLLNMDDDISHPDSFNSKEKEENNDGYHLSIESDQYKTEEEAPYIDALYEDAHYIINMSPPEDEPENDEQNEATNEQKNESKTEVKMELKSDNIKNKEEDLFLEKAIYCHAKRFDPLSKDIFIPADPIKMKAAITNREAISSMRGSFFYCGNNKLANRLTKACGKNNYPLKRESFSF